MSDRLVDQSDIDAMIRGMPFKPATETGWKATIRRIIKAQDLRTDRLSREDERRKMAEWLDGWCDQSLHSEETYSTVDVPRRDCPDCYDELLEKCRKGRTPWDKP